MVIEFHGELDPASIKKAALLMSKPSLGMIILRVVVVVLILATLGGLVFSHFSGEPIAGAQLVRLIITDVLLGAFVVQPYFASRQLFKRLSIRSRPVDGMAAPTGISYKTGGSDEQLEYPWDSFYHAYQAEDLIVLATADWRTSILPRSLFASRQDWEHFCQYVAARVKPVK